VKEYLVLPLRGASSFIGTLSPTPATVDLSQGRRLASGNISGVYSCCMELLLIAPGHEQVRRGYSGVKNTTNRRKAPLNLRITHHWLALGGAPFTINLWKGLKKTTPIEIQ